MRGIARCRLQGLVLALLVSLTLGVGATAHAQSLSTVDLAGTWSFFQLATPSSNVSSSNIISYTASLTFGADGTVGGNFVDAGAHSGNAVSSGVFSVTADGQVQGFFSCCDDVAQDFVITGARMLTNKHTIVGTATIFGQAGLFNLVKLENQTFDLNTDLAGDWSYHELTPSNNLPRTTAGASQGDAAWVNGAITFHANGCTDAALTLSDGTVRSQVTGTPGVPFG